MSSKGTRGAKATLQAIDGGLSGVPKAPAHFKPDMVAERNVIAAELVERRILTASMVGLVETYVSALWMVREAQKEIAAIGLLVKTAHGMPKPNPACGTLKSAFEAVARLGAELGLTPAARAKQGFQPKGGDDDDDSDLGL
ncbi:phage terminase small subunit P27 family [Pararhizobium sp. YC-54]|uniref:phage terminase small subunit P27 family n=1 Tax=Pararhizobium sp. YC-54 TaxID=2986920 RepID=UPI0021F76875|nr:phage terminase small subunit P27 family [Pararhizobium sp. YC-54]MCV9997681.1 phage terminase small subunit P27 family [Pararhizobium sp. YC-54]